MLNLGPSRADGLPGVEKIEVASRAVLRDAAREVAYVMRILASHPETESLLGLRGSSANNDPVVGHFLTSGIVKPPLDEGEGDVARGQSR